MVLSEVQLITLRRIQNGTKHQLRGDRAIGLEMRRDISACNRKDITCRSLAPLMRAGLIEFITHPTDKTRYYEVRLTETGRELIEEE